MPIVVAEHRDHRHRQRPADLGEQLGLRRLAVGRDVARHEDQVRVVLERPDGSRDLLAIRVPDVQVARGRHADGGAGKAVLRRSHDPQVPGSARFSNQGPGMRGIWRTSTRSTT